jgi:hypothetical protein
MVETPLGARLLEDLHDLEADPGASDDGRHDGVAGDDAAVAMPVRIAQGSSTGRSRCRRPAADR